MVKGRDAHPARLRRGAAPRGLRQARRPFRRRRPHGRFGSPDRVRLAGGSARRCPHRVGLRRRHASRGGARGGGPLSPPPPLFPGPGGGPPPPPGTPDPPPRPPASPPRCPPPPP